jgi:hypothetical protein
MRILKALPVRTGLYGHFSATNLAPARSRVARHFTLLSLRSLLQRRTGDLVREPVLLVEDARVAAVWECGCIAMGTHFEGLAWTGCGLHERRARPVFCRRA